ncbi:MAG: hybrid sensor histidine kinase/response regulator [Anaerolineae bacterium]|nr:hybrid sensor histidine kinase/response regulator [Anaerolineae bacterium]
MSTPSTILNVEDTPENRHLVRRILESQGYQVVDAENALQGIEKALEIRPDLILMDINLPDLDGFTAVTRMRSYSQLSSVPILALTARTVHDDRERAKAIGCDGYLNKPIDFDELITQVGRHIAAGHRESEPETKREYYLKEQSVNLIEELERKFSELKSTYDRLRHFEEAKSNFISVASHELRTPLTVIHSYTQMLQMLPAISTDPNAKELLDGVNKGVKRLQEIMNDMVSVIRVELADQNVKFGPVSIRSVIKSIENEQRNKITDRQLTFDVTIKQDLPMVQGDSKQLHSALSRIVTNAVKYTPDGGRISITADLLTEKEKTFVEIVIADTGVGIELAKQKMIFEKFGTAEDVALHSTSKTKFMGGGVGLGLTIAKGVIEAHEGRIWVESEGYNKEKLPGSKFFILLPTQDSLA